VTALERLRTIASTDPALAPMAVLQVEAIEAAHDPAWERAVPELDGARLRDGIPLLHETTLRVDGALALALLRRLARAAAEHAGVLVDDALNSESEAVELVQASITRDTERLRTLADRTGVEMNLLATLGSIAVVPLLQACARHGGPLLRAGGWSESYCPVCAAWPTVAEMRGLERERWLRCGRCGAGWSFRGQVCAFCGCSEHKDLSYLAPEGERDSRRAETCDCCGSYLKTLATLGALEPEEVLLRDIDSVELDIAALQKGYGRPEKQPFPLRVIVETLGMRDGVDG